MLGKNEEKNVVINQLLKKLDLENEVLKRKL